MAETNESLTWWVGATDAEIQKHYRLAEDDARRSKMRGWESSQEVVQHDLSHVAATVGLSEEDAEASRAKVDAFFRRLAEWKKENKVRGKIADTLQGMLDLADNDPSKKTLSTVLGIDKGSARDRLATIKKHMPVLQQIAREVGLGG